jgi:protein tyrosine/serine phosphatase
MPHVFRLAAAVTVASLMVGVPWWYKRTYDRHFRNFHVVEDGVLYRSAQLDLDGLKHIVREYGIRTIVCLRDGATSDDRAEAEWANAAGLRHVRVPPRKWWSDSGPVPAEEGLAVFREVMLDPANHPVLVHCFAGIHRTGAYCAVYRMDFQGWCNRDAIAELRTMGYSTLDDDPDILIFLERYRTPFSTAGQFRTAP